VHSGHGLGMSEHGEDGGSGRGVPGNDGSGRFRQLVREEPGRLVPLKPQHRG